MNLTRSKAQRFYRARPFVALSQRKRREFYVCLRWKIRCEAPLYGGRFTSRLVMEEDRPELYNQWFDFYFLGRDRFTIWNASICTARLAFRDAVTDLALDRTFAKLTPEECEEENKLEREFSSYKDGRRYYTLKKNPERTYDKLNGLSFREYWENLPYESERESLARIDYPSVLLGQKIRGSR